MAVNNLISFIPVGNMALAFMPTLAVAAILSAWSHDYRKSLLAIARMLVQLLLIGYVLSYVFGTDSPGIVLSVLAFMVCVSSWISMRTSGYPIRDWYGKALGSIALGRATTHYHHSSRASDSAMVSDRFHDSVSRNVFLELDEQRQSGGRTI